MVCNFYLLYPQMVDNFVFLNVPLSNCEGIPKSPTVLDQLKTSEFSHENLGQLNAYVSYFRENEMQPGDNPPIGILLCTRKGKKMVEYALAGMDNQLFVSTYMLQLPDKKTLEDFLLKQFTVGAFSFCPTQKYYPKSLAVTIISRNFASG